MHFWLTGGTAPATLASSVSFSSRPPLPPIRPGMPATGKLLANVTPNSGLLRHELSARLSVDRQALPCAPAEEFLDVHIYLDGIQPDKFRTA